MADVNPITWTKDVKALIQLAALIVTIVGSVAGSAIYLGDKIYTFAETQVVLAEQLKTLRVDFQQANIDREKSLDSLKADVVPRIGKLEDDMRSSIANAAAVKQRSDDMKEDLRELKDLATKNLSVTESHDADIRATRNAVAPK